jgi:phosphoserine phosphatase RsbU/P
MTVPGDGAATVGGDGMAETTTGTAADHGRVDDLERRLRAEVEVRKQLVDVAVRLSSTLNLEELLQLIMTSAADLLGAETSSLLLLDEDTNELVIEVATGDVGGQVVKRRVPAGAGIAGWTLSNRQPAVIHDPASDERFYKDVGEAVGFETRNLLAVPLLVKDRAVGVVEVINKKGDERFTERDVELANALASLAAVAVDNASLYAQLADAVVTARMSYRL